MNSGHDVGGMHGFGPIDVLDEGSTPVFDADWERRVFAMCVSMWHLEAWSGDRDRYAVEQQNPMDYWRNTYYQNWLVGLQRLLVECDLMSAEELAHGGATSIASKVLRDARLTLDEVMQPDPTTGLVQSLDTPPRFEIGDKVRAVNRHPTGHTRAPRYVRGRIGSVFANHGVQVFADKNAEGLRELQYVYAVRFESTELWGESGNAFDAVYVDLWDEHLETTQ